MKKRDMAAVNREVAHRIKKSIVRRAARPIGHESRRGVFWFTPPRKDDLFVIFAKELGGEMDTSIVAEGAWRFPKESMITARELILRCFPELRALTPASTW